MAIKIEPIKEQALVGILGAEKVKELFGDIERIEAEAETSGLTPKEVRTKAEPTDEVEEIDLSQLSADELLAGLESGEIVLLDESGQELQPELDFESEGDEPEVITEEQLKEAFESVIEPLNAQLQVVTKALEDAQATIQAQDATIKELSGSVPRAVKKLKASEAETTIVSKETAEKSAPTSNAPAEFMDFVFSPGLGQPPVAR